MVVQIAKWAGLLISATSSAAKKEFVQSLGASEVFDYGKTSIEDINKAYDVLIDCVGGDTLRKSFKLLKGGGKLISVARAPTDEEVAQRPDVDAGFFIVEPDGEELTRIAQLCEQGLIKPVVQTVMPLEEGAKAFEILAAGHTKGKIVLKVE